MASDNDRRELHVALERQLGERPATILMELLPPAGYADLVRESEFRVFRSEVKGEFSAVRAEIAELRGEFAELRGEFAELRGKVDGLLGKFLAATVPMMFGSSALVLAAAKLA